MSVRYRDKEEVQMKIQIDMRKVFFTAFCTAILVSLGFAAYILRITQDVESSVVGWVKESNMKFYFLLLLLFGAVFLMVRAACIPFHPMERAEKRRTISWGAQGILVGIPIAAAVGLLIRWFCVDWLTEFPNSAAGLFEMYSIPAVLWILLVVAAAFLSFFMVAKKRDIALVTVYVVYVFCLAIYFYSLYYVNLFQTDLHHSTAVVESIYNVCDLVPFSEVTTGIYGHYSLFFFLPVRLLNGSPYAVSGLIASAGCLSAAATFYVTHTLLPANWLRAAAACAAVSVTAILYGSPYWQIHPIRELFPMLMLAFACGLMKRGFRVWGTKWTWIGYGLGSLAVIWNTESGLFCLAAFSAYILMEQLQQYQWYERAILVCSIKLALFCAGSVLLSIAVVNSYNLLCGGKLILRAFFFPLFSNDYMNQSIRYDMVWGNYSWVYVFLLFTGLLAAGLYHTRLFRKKGSCTCREAPLAVMAALLGLFSFSYYANRAAYMNLTICYLEAVCANALMIGRTWKDIHVWNKNVGFFELAKKSIAVFTIFIVVTLGVQLPLSFIQLAGDAHQVQVRSAEGIQSDLSALIEEVPENTYGVGTGISMLYHMLDWDHYAHVRDFSDLYTGGNDVVTEALIEEILQKDDFLLSGVTNNVSLLARLFLREPSFQLKKTYHIQGYPFYYYQKAKEQASDWMLPYMYADENEKTNEQAIFVEPGKQIYGPYVYLKAGSYMLHVNTSGDAYLMIYYSGGSDMVLEQALSAGENQIAFTLLQDAWDLEFKIVNTGSKEIKIMDLYVEAGKS